MTDFADLEAAIADIAKRTRTDGAFTLVSDLRRSLAALERDMTSAGKHPVMSVDVVKQCGDAMLTLARIAMHYGAQTGLDPLSLATSRLARTLDIFDNLKTKMAPADAWARAREMVR